MATASAVRKVVTVMFADLGGSTGFGERNDPETAREVMARYHALMLAAVEHQGGTVAKFIGDGVMAVWGVPEIVEDDAARAVAAGTEMQAAFVGFADDVAGRLGEQLTLRIGINTGEVVIAAGDADMVGDALNVAARLEKACDPGRVVVGEETWRLTRGALAYEPLGEVAVAGRAEPVAIFRLVESTSVIEEASTPFVGRDPELDRLRAVFDAAVATQSARFATVLGAPGVGKTRLARQLIAALGVDAQALEMRCDRNGEATFAPIVDLLRAAADLGDGADPDATRAAVASVLQRAGVDRDLERATDAVASLLGTGPTRSVEETFWAVRRLVEALANDRPVVLVIDDIQWAEPLLLDLLDHLTEWVTGAPLLLVALARPELRASRPAMTETGRGIAEVVALDGLDSGATAQLAGLLLGTDQLPAEIVERLPASTDGNPLFVRELVRMLVDDHIIERHGDEWRLAIDADAIEVPPTIQSLLAARVERLPADERAVLERASIIGSEFNLGALRHLVEPADQPALPDLLERLRRKELVEPTGAWWGNEPVHRFHHVLIRDATYRRQLKATRAELHERVGRWTDDMSAGVIGEHEAAIAYHFEQAHDLRQQLGPLDDRARALGQRAAELLTTAAGRALDREDLSAAGGLAARAVALCGSDDGVAVPALLIGCEAVLASGDARTATSLVDDLATRATGDARLGALADCFRAEMLVLTDPDQLAVAEGLATEAAGILHEIGDLAGAGKAHVVRSMVLARLGRVGESEHDLDAALAAARAVDDHRRVTAVLGAAPAAALWGPSPLARVGGRCVDVVRMLRMTTPSPSVEAASMRTQAVLEALVGHVGVARSILGRSRGPLEDLGLQHGLLETDLYAGIIEMIAGDPVAAEPLLRSAFDGLGSIGVDADAGLAAARLAGALLAQGRVDEADEIATASEVLAGQNLKTAIAWRGARAELLACRGEHERAIDLAEQAVAIAEGTDLLLDHADASVSLARVRSAAGDDGGAADANAAAAELYRTKGASALATRIDGASAHESTAADDPLFPGLRVPRGQPMLSLENLATAAAMRHVVHAAVEVEADLEVGATPLVPMVVSVRGDRLALVRVRARVASGAEVTSLALCETDIDGQLIATSHFADRDILEAQAALVDRHAAGHGDRLAHVIRGEIELNALRGARDWDAYEALMPPDFVFEDHRPLRWGRGDRALWMQNERSLCEEVPDNVNLLRTRVMHRGATLELFSSFGTTVDGSASAKSGIAVSLLNGDREWKRIEVFDIDQADLAVARFDELVGAAGLEVDGAAAVAPPPFEHRMLSGEPVPAHHLFSLDNLATAAAAAAGIITRPDPGLTPLPPIVLCVRGDRLALIRLRWRSATGDERTSLLLCETDAAGQLVATIDFEETDIMGAILALLDRYGAGEAAAFAAVIDADREFHVMRAARDWEAMEVRLSDVVYEDHRPLGWGRGDGATMLHNERTHAERLPDYVAIDRTFSYRGGASLKVFDTVGTTVDGVTSIKSGISLLFEDPHGGPALVEFFDVDQADLAVGRFSELAGTDGGEVARRVDGSLRVAAPLEHRMLSGDAVPAHPLFSLENLATAVAAGAGLVDQHGRGSTPLSPIVLCVRGDRLALVRVRSRSATGGEVTSLVLYETDDTGHLIATTDFEERQIDAALRALMDTYALGDGAAFARRIEFDSRVNDLRADRDWETLTAMISPDLVYEDHRPLGWGVGDRTTWLHNEQTHAERLPDLVVLVRTYRHLNGATIMLFDSTGTTVDGVESIKAAISVFTYPDRPVPRMELFDLDQADLAVARFFELAGDDATEGHQETEPAR